MTLSQRVAARYLVAYLAPKEMLKLFERTKARLLPLLRDDARAEEAKALYLEMAEQMRPTAVALEGIIIQRPDEVRKLKNLQGWLRSLKRETSPDRFKDAETPREVNMFISMGLDYLGETLKSLARVQDRLQDYGTIERKFAHGPWTIVNNFGYRPEEFGPPLETLDKATEHVQRSGFGGAIYGDIILEGAGEFRNYSGMYREAYDDIRLNASARKRYDDIYTLVHEIGHRVWYKILSGGQRDAYEDGYVGTTRAITLPERESFWAALERADFDPRRAESALPDELRPLFKAYWKETTKGTMPPSPASIKLMGREPVYRQFVRPKTRYYVLDSAPTKSVTDYGQTNVKEDFAEVFAHYCMGKALTPDAAERFRAATGKG